MDYAKVERELGAGLTRFDARLVNDYIADCSRHPIYRRMANIKNVSMLAVETLMLMRGFAIEARGGIVEIGPYIGGSTIALLLGIEASSPKPLVSIDPGGAYLDHPSMPSADIHADWRKNVAEYAPGGRVTLVAGLSFQQHVAEEAIKALGGEKIGLLIIDANGDVWQNMEPFVPHLTDDCLFVFDDYTNLTSSGDNVKFEMTRASVDEAASSGAIDRYGVFLWGTWFGRRSPNFMRHWSALLDSERQRSKA